MGFAKNKSISVNQNLVSVILVNQVAAFYNHLFGGG